MEQRRQQLREILAIFGPRKDFRGPVLGNPTLHRLGLHPARIALSDLCLTLRRRQTPTGDIATWANTLRRDGIVVLENFLPQTQFAAVRAEAQERIRTLAERNRPPKCQSRGFGPRLPFDGGFDRYDGGTLNRFVHIDESLTPHCHRAVRDSALTQLISFASGFRHRPQRFFIYQTVHGEERANPDIQKQIHRDTFHSTIKLWLFLDDVTHDDGPFMYTPGSHRMDRRRYAWEYHKAQAVSSREGRLRGGAFRIAADELTAMGLRPPQPYPLRGNTLVLADVRGFHRRGDAPAGAARLSIYASLRQWPFSPVAY